MYEKDFFERLNLQQLCAFLRTGGRLSPKAVEHGTLWERIRRAEDAWEAAMKAYRDKILTTDYLQQCRQIYPLIWLHRPVLLSVKPFRWSIALVGTSIY